nr:tetratricopeptide repeat protein [Bifidobacterium dentium]
MDEFIDYYEVLGVDKSARMDEIHKAGVIAIRRASKLSTHPDMEKQQKGQRDLKAAEEAMDILTDEAKRKAYDTSYDRDKAAAEKATQAENDAARRQAESDTTGDFIQDAIDYMDCSQWRNASMAAKEATRQNPKNAKAWFVRGEAAMNLSDYADAAFSLAQADKLDPDNATILCTLGEAYDYEGKPKESEPYFRRAYQLQPNNSYYGGRIAWSLSDQGRLKEALDFCTELYKKFKDDRYIRGTYVNILLNDIEASGHQMPNGTYLYVSKEQLAYAQKRFAEIDSIGVPNGDNYKSMRERLAQDRAYMEKCSHRRFTWQGVGFYGRLVVIWFVALFALSFINLQGSVGGLIYIVLTVGMIAYAIEKTFPSQLKLNAKAS